MKQFRSERHAFWSGVQTILAMSPGIFPFAAVLSAIIAPAVLMPDQQWISVTGNAQLWAALAAGLVAWYFKSIFRTLLVGISLYWLLLWLGMS